MQDYLESHSFETTFSVFVYPEPSDFGVSIKPQFDITEFQLEYDILIGEPWDFDFPTYLPHGLELEIEY